MSEVLLMALAVAVACGLVGAVAWLLVRGAETPERVSTRWPDSFSRERRDGDA